VDFETLTQTYFVAGQPHGGMGVDHILIYEHGGRLLSTTWGPARSS
jgi:hypothetical protein